MFSAQIPNENRSNYLCGTLETDFNKAGNILFNTESKTYDWTAESPTWFRIGDEYYTYDENENMLTSKQYVYTQDEENAREAYISEYDTYSIHTGGMRRECRGLGLRHSFCPAGVRPSGFTTVFI